MITVANRLLSCQQQCSSYESDNLLEKVVMQELVGRVVSFGAACLFHAEAVSRAVKICFWVIQEIFSHLEDPWLTIPWLEQEKELLKKTYGDSLYSFAETIYPHKPAVIEESREEIVIHPSTVLASEAIPTPVALPLLASPPLRPGARAPSPELLFDRFSISPRSSPTPSTGFQDVLLMDPDAQRRLTESRTPSIQDVELIDQDAQRELRESPTPVDPFQDVEHMDPNAEPYFRETPEAPVFVVQAPRQVPTDLIHIVNVSTPITFPTIQPAQTSQLARPVWHIQPPPRISTDPIHVVKPSERIAFPSITLPPPQAHQDMSTLRHIQPPPVVPTDLIHVVKPSEPTTFSSIVLPPPQAHQDIPTLRRIQPPPVVPTDLIHVVKPSEPIVFPSLPRPPSPEWEDLAPQIPTLQLQPPSNQTMHTVNSGDEWDALSSARTEEPKSARLTITTPPTGTSTARSTASMVAHLQKGPFQPVITTPRSEEEND